MPKITNTRFCQVIDSLTFSEFGCEPAYFDGYIKDQKLQIIAKVVGFYVVLDSEEEQWIVAQDDVFLIGEEAVA